MVDTPCKSVVMSITDKYHNSASARFGVATILVKKQKKAKTIFQFSNAVRLSLSCACADEMQNFEVTSHGG